MRKLFAIILCSVFGLSINLKAEDHKGSVPTEKDAHHMMDDADSHMADAHKHMDEMGNPSHRGEMADHGAENPKVKAVAKEAPKQSHMKTSDAVHPQIAFGWLKNGNNRFRTHRFRGDGKSKKDRLRLTSGQKPHSIILTCADSRVPPEVVFDQSLGEIFVIRSAGEALDSAVIASIEYAVDHLGTRNLVVMGHTSCGAVTAAMVTKKGESAGSEHLDKLVADIQPRLGEIPARYPATVEQHSWKNARGVAHDLEARSAIIKKAVVSGQLVIRPAMYHLDTGRVEF